MDAARYHRLQLLLRLAGLALTVAYLLGFLLLENTIMRSTAAGSGHEAGEFTTYRMTTPYGMIRVMTARLTPDTPMQAT